MARPKKPKSQLAVRATISVPMPMFVKAADRQRAKGLNSFSAYVQVLIHNDQVASVTVKEAA